jgi:tRNA threonylcarbamoyladenosine biosynthesis protein TsaE
MKLFDKDFNKDEIASVAAMLSTKIKSYPLITFSGELGAGKTTLIKALCETLGVQEKVTSPTYSLVNQYQGSMDNAPVQIHHIDLYRLNTEEEAFQAGIDEILETAEVCLVEWPQRLPGWVDRRRLEVVLSASSPELRHVEVFTHEN